MDNLLVGLPAFRFMNLNVNLTLFDVLIRMVISRSGNPQPRVAVVGYDPSILDNAEVLHDSLPGYAVPKLDAPGDAVSTGGLHYYAGDPNDASNENRPLEQLKFTDYDAVLIAAADPSQEFDLNAAIQQIYASEGASSCIVMRMTQLRVAFLSALLNLREDFYFSCLNPRKMAAVAISLVLTGNLRGCVIECGTYLGGTTVFIGSLLRELGDFRRVHTLDTFGGMPAPTAPDGQTVYQAGLFNSTSFDHVSNCVLAHNLQGAIEMHKGLVQDTLPTLWSREQSVSFALIDTDQYAGTAAGLKEILPRLDRGGLIIIDDYGVDGVRQAIRDSMATDQSLRGAVILCNFFLMWRDGVASRGR